MMAEKYASTAEVNEVFILDVCEDLGIDYYKKKGAKNDFAILCPIKSHGDRHLGTCVIDTDKNCWYCFACNEGGGPIQLVMTYKKLSFDDAKMFIAEKHGKTKDFNPFFKIWEGLTDEEYQLFGLKSSLVKTDETGGKRRYYKRYTLRMLAKDNPELHDEILINKFIERAIHMADFMCLQDVGYFPLEFGMNLLLTPEYENIFNLLFSELLGLLDKGLMDKTKNPFKKVA